MNKYWIYKSWADSLFILFPPFLVLFFVIFFQEQILVLETNYSFFNWLIFIVFIDVAHVYSTLYKTYFNPVERKSKRILLIVLPLVSFVFGIVIYAVGNSFFWTVLAYIAVFHFIRQQYGFMRLYARNEDNKNDFLDQLAIYNATVYPMLYWFLTPKKNYTWFVENEFFTYESPTLIKLFTGIYFIIICVYLLHVIVKFFFHNEFNFPKNMIILGTYLSWYCGIVYYNNDLIFTMLNVVSHGIPYIALVYMNQKNANHIMILPKLSKSLGVLVFLFLILFFAFSEEFLWEFLVWNEHFVFFNFVNPFENWHFILVPLLTVPQLTHYLLDGFIWKGRS